jgi:predicted PurR-regulated permease PerM
MVGHQSVHEDRADSRDERARRSFEQRVGVHMVGAATLALALALLWLCWMLARPIALLIAAIILASAVEPVVHGLMRWMRRSFAIAVIAATLLGAIVIVAAVVAPRVDDQIAEVGRSIPSLIERGQSVVERWLPLSGGLGSQLVQPSESSGGGRGLATYPLAIASSMFEAMLVTFMSLYWLVAMPAVREFILSLLPPDRTSEARSLLSEIGSTMGGYVRGVLIEALLIGVLVFVGLQVIGVPYALALAVLAGVGEFLPYVGPIVAAVPAVLLGLLESPSQGLIVLLFYVILQLVEGYVLFPLVVGNQSDIPPLLIILGLLGGGALGGVLGALIVVPLAGALRIVVLRLMAPAIRRRTGGIHFAVDDEDRTTLVVS